MTTEPPGWSENIQRVQMVAYTMSYLGFRWVMYDEQCNIIGRFEGTTSTEAVQQAMSVIIDRGEFGSGDWFRAGEGEYEYRRAIYPT